VNWKESFEGDIKDGGIIPIGNTDDGGEMFISLLLYPEYFMGDPARADDTPLIRAELWYPDDQIDDPKILAGYGVRLIDYTYDEPEKFEKDVTYVVGSPVTYQISLSDYYKVITGESLKWSRKPYQFKDSSDADTAVSEGDTNDVGVSKSPVEFGIFNAIGHAAFIVINTGRTINNNNFEGYYLGLNDNTFVTPSSEYIFDCIENVKVTTKTFSVSRDADDKLIQTGLMDTYANTGDYHSLNKNRLSFQLNSNSQGSISKVLSRDITSMDISTSEYDDMEKELINCIAMREAYFNEF
jgi:hypothetical protein